MALEFYSGKQKTFTQDRELTVIFIVFNVTLNTGHGVLTQELRISENILHGYSLNLLWIKLQLMHCIAHNENQDIL